MKKRELKELIEQGEGYFVEFKEQIGVGLDKEMVAFANASGGKIVIGVADGGKIIGCTTDNTVRSKVQDIANNCDPRILIHIKTLRYEGVKLLVVSVDESLDKPVRCSKGFFPIDTVFYVKTRLSLYYVFYNLQTQNFINTDAAIPGLSRNQACLLAFIVPPYSILKQFEEMIKPFFALVIKMKDKIEVLKHTRDLLLPKLISGAPDVSDLDIKTGGHMQ